MCACYVCVCVHEEEREIARERERYSSAAQLNCRIPVCFYEALPCVDVVVGFRVG